MQNLVGFFEILMILWFCCFLAANARRYEQTLVTRIFPIANSVYFIAIIKKTQLLIVIKIALCITNQNGSSTCLWARISTEKLAIYSFYHIFFRFFLGISDDKWIVPYKFEVSSCWICLYNFSSFLLVRSIFGTYCQNLGASSYGPNRLAWPRSWSFEVNGQVGLDMVWQVWVWLDLIV